MKILACTDMHSNMIVLDKIIKKARDCDAVFCCGDITIFGNGLKKVLAKLNSIGRTVFIIPGNHEDTLEFKNECNKYDKIINVNQKIALLDKYLIFGFGGGGFSRRDSNLDVISRKMKGVITENNDKIKIMLTHAPPSDTKLDIIVGGHCGNKSINEVIIKYNFNYLFCGHIHETFKKVDKLNNTICMNPGPEGIIIEI